MLKKMLMSALVAALAMSAIACDEADKLERTLDNASKIASDVAGCKKTQICIQSEAFSASITGKDSCETKSESGTRYIAENHDAMDKAITEYSGVTDWKSVDSGTCSLVTIRAIAKCAADMKNTYKDLKACESSMTDEQKQTMSTWDSFNDNLEKVANDSNAAAAQQESNEG